MRFVGTDAIPGEGYGVEQVLSGELMRHLSIPQAETV